MKKKTKYKPYNLLKLKEIIDTAVEFCGDVAKYADVEFYLEDELLELKDVVQYSVKPDVEIQFKRII
jgi:hypothetical protein